MNSRRFKLVVHRQNAIWYFSGSPKILCSAFRIAATSVWMSMLWTRASAFWESCMDELLIALLIMNVIGLLAYLNYLLCLLLINTRLSSSTLFPPAFFYLCE